MNHQSSTFLDYLGVNLWVPQPTAPIPPTPPCTYLYILYCYFLIIHPNNLGLFQFKEEIHVLSYNLIPKSMYYAYKNTLKKIQTHEKEGTHEATPPYLLDHGSSQHVTIFIHFARTIRIIKSKNYLFTFEDNYFIFSPVLCLFIKYRAVFNSMKNKFFW